MLQEIQIGDMDNNFRRIVGVSALKHEILIKSGNEPIAKIIPFRPKETQKKKSTAADLLNSEIVGMWRDREDINDSIEFAHTLREKSQTRKVI